MSGGELIATDRPLEDAQRALQGWFRVLPGAVVSARRTYLDTFDGLLREAGLVLSEEGQTRTLSSRDGSMLASGTEVEEIAGVRALLPIAALDLSVQPIDVLDEREKTVCRLVLEQPAGLPARLRLNGLRGYRREFARIHELLVTRGGFRPTSVPLVDEAVAAAGGDPNPASARVEVELAPDEPAQDAVARVLRRLLEIMDQNLPGTLADTDTEFLHDYRVAVRRTRSVLRELRGVFPPDELARLRAEFRWLQEVTGPTRDLDVYLLEFEQLRALAPAAVRADLDPLLAVLRSWHAEARMQMERDLVGVRARRLRADWNYMLTVLGHTALGDRPDAQRPIGELVAARIWNVHRRMVRMGDAISAQSAPEEYHELRKRGKELRYLLELFGSQLFDPAVVRPMVKALKGLQDVLGRHQDRETQVLTLRRLGDHVLAQSGGSAALLAMGALVERLEEDAQLAREQFAASFSQFASAQQRALVRDTFKRYGA